MAEKRKRIKILYTIPNFDTAGSGKVLYDLAEGLNKERFEVEIGCNHNRGALFSEVEKLGLTIHIHSFTTPYRPWLTLPFRVKKLSSFFKQHQFDLIHSWHWSSDWTEPLAARLAGIPWIYTKKAMSWGNMHWKVRSWLASFIITINDEMIDFFPKKKNQRIIPIGLDLEFYKRNESERKVSSSFQIVTVANLVPVKGIEVLIRAVHYLAHNDIQIMVIGDDRDPYAKELKSLASKLLGPSKIIFKGKKSDIRQLLSTADLYVIPTLDSGRREGMPMALVEAMSMGVPVLGSNISGIKYVLKDFPEYLFSAGNYIELAEKITTIKNLTHQSRWKIGSSLRLYCEVKFSKERFIEEHVSLYSSLVKY